jgi:hypothetical protein
MSETVALLKGQTLDLILLLTHRGSTSDYACETAVGMKSLKAVWKSR